MVDESTAPVSRRALFRMIGAAAGSAVMYQAMSELGHAGESGYTGPIELSPPQKRPQSGRFRQ